MPVASTQTVQRQYQSVATAPEWPSAARRKSCWHTSSSTARTMNQNKISKHGWFWPNALDCTSCWFSRAVQNSKTWNPVCMFQSYIYIRISVYLYICVYIYIYVFIYISIKTKFCSMFYVALSALLRFSDCQMPKTFIILHLNSENGPSNTLLPLCRNIIKELFNDYSAPQRTRAAPRYWKHKPAHMDGSPMMGEHMHTHIIIYLYASISINLSYVITKRSFGI